MLCINGYLDWSLSALLSPKGIIKPKACYCNLGCKKFMSHKAIYYF